MKPPATRSRVIRSLPPMRPAANVALVGALTIFVLTTLQFVDESSDVDRAVGLPAHALVLVAAAATFLRRNWPVLALLVSSLATAAYLTLAYPFGPIIGFVVLCVYALARRRPVGQAAPVAVVTLLLLLVHSFTHPGAIGGAGGIAAGAAWVTIPFTVGAARRLVVAADERERAAAARQAVDAERLRLSQEVHDVVGHGLAAIQMQADIALHVEQQRPEQARAALAAISRASEDALEDLRETLRRIDPAKENADARASTTPTPGLDRAEELCARVTEAGVRADLKVAGTVAPLPTAADVAAYRLLQESLTNVVKHSAHPRATVSVEHTEEAVLLEVTNQDLDADEMAPGIGITGMRRRAATVGGTLYAGPGTEPGTFTVRAAIPRRHARDLERSLQWTRDHGTARRRPESPARPQPGPTSAGP